MQPTKAKPRSLKELRDEYGPLDRRDDYGDTIWVDTRGYVRLVRTADGEKYEPEPGGPYGGD